jgi:hypothetical protein
LAIFLGPFFFSTTADSMERISRMPGFQAPETQHYFRLVAKWDLYRTSAFFPALVGLWAGASIAVLRGFDGRPGTLVLVTAVVTAILTAAGLLMATYVGTLDTPGTWVPPLALPAVLVLVALERKGVGGHRALAACGAVLGLLTYAVYGGTLGGGILALLAALTMPLGAIAGGLIWRVIESPHSNAVARLVATLGVLTPLLLGYFDLYLRLNTP